GQGMRATPGSCTPLRLWPPEQAKLGFFALPLVPLAQSTTSTSEHTLPRDKPGVTRGRASKLGAPLTPSLSKGERGSFRKRLRQSPLLPLREGGPAKPGRMRGALSLQRT